MLAIAVAALLTVAYLPASSPVAAQPKGFEGIWEGTDSGDGSRMRLWIRPDDGGSDIVFDIRYFDQSCGACGGLPGRGHFIAALVEEDHLSGSGYFWAQGRWIGWQNVPLDLFYDSGSDTIIERQGDYYQGIWYRASGN
jgi:hypothetical protein